MARCEQGYLCQVCGAEVEGIAESDLYLRYVIGDLDPEVLHTTPERHLACNPVLAQFIDHPRFPPLFAQPPFDRRDLDAEFVRQRQRLVTRGYERLLELAAAGGEADVTGYPLPEAAIKYRGEAESAGHDHQRSEKLQSRKPT